jgi:protease II
MVRALKKQQPVLGGFNKEDYASERHWATATDGTRVPISLVFNKRATKRDGSDPLLLNAYGAYEIPNDPYFSSNRLSLLDRGFVFAIAHVRGGGAMIVLWPRCQYVSGPSIVTALLLLFACRRSTNRCCSAERLSSHAGEI